MRILIVEDEKKIAEFIKRGLKEENHAVDAAFDGLEGLRLAEENPYDLLILDVMLPGMDGLTLCAKLRAGGFTAPIMMLTAKDLVEDKVKGLDSGANDYLTKPFAFEELLARVRALLRKTPGQSSTKLKAGDLELDLMTHKALRGGKELSLSVKEFALLEFFVRHAGRALTRDEILRQVWGYDVFVTARSVDRCINTLRGKIEIDPEQPAFIKTLKSKHGFIINGGYGKIKGLTFRISNMGNENTATMRELIDAMDDVLG